MTIDKQFVPPALPLPPGEYSATYHNELNKVLRLYFNLLNLHLDSVVNVLNYTGPFDTVYANTVDATTVNADRLNALVAAVSQGVFGNVQAGGFQGGNAVFANMTASNANASMFTGSGRQINLPYGAFSDNQDQYTYATDTAYPVRFDTTDFSYGVSISSRTASFTATIDDGTPPGAGTVMTVSAVSSGSLMPGMLVTGGSTSANTYIVKQLTGTTGSTGTYQVSVSQERTSASLTGAVQSKITFAYPGIYNIQFSIQFANPDPAISSVDVWGALGGTYIPSTNTRFNIISSHGGGDGHICGSLNLFISVDDVNADFFELYWWSDDVDTLMEYKVAGTSPTRPATPSIILTAAFVSAPVPAKTLVTPIGVLGTGSVGTVTFFIT